MNIFLAIWKLFILYAHLNVLLILACIFILDDCTKLTILIWFEEYDDLESILLLWSFLYTFRKIENKTILIIIHIKKKVHTNKEILLI